MTAGKDCRDICPDLVRGAREFGVDLDTSQQGLFVAFCQALQDTSGHLNVTGVRDASRIMSILFLDSLSLETSLRTHFATGILQRLRVIDVGSGAGIPGVPLKIAHPHWRVTLVESIRKKAHFIETVIQDLALADVVVEPRRSEDVAREYDHRDSYDFAVARAVASLSTLIELCAPFVRPDGALLFPKSGDVRREMEEAEEAQKTLGVRGPFLEETATRSDNGTRRFVVRYQKVRSTPRKFPRHVGLAKTEPLGK